MRKLRLRLKSLASSPATSQCNKTAKARSFCCFGFLSSLYRTAGMVTKENVGSGKDLEFIVQISHCTDKLRPREAKCLKFTRVVKGRELRPIIIVTMVYYLLTGCKLICQITLSFTLHINSMR